MNEELLRLLYGKFTTDATFEQFTEDLQQNDDLLTEAYNRLEEKPDFETFKKDLFDSSSTEQAKMTPQEAGAPVEGDVAPDMDSSLEDTSSESQEDKYAFEKPFQGTFFGDVVLDFFGDLGRSIEAGVEQAEMIDPALEIMGKGKDVSPEFVEKMIELSENPPEVSDEMREFQKIYEEEGGGTFAFLKGLVKTRGQVAPQILLQSVTTMFASLANKESLAAGAAGAVTGAGAGAAAGSIGGPLAGITALGGGVGGLITGVSGTMESSLSFAELLQEELEKEGKDFTKENVNNLLQDEEKFKSIRNRAIGRGVTIGAVEGIGTALTGGAVKAISGTGRAARLARVATSVAGEAVAGGVGEAAGMAVAGQELNAMDIGFETIGSVSGAPISVAMAAKNKNQTYIVNGDKVSKEKINDIVDSDDGSNLARSVIKIKNDDELKAKIQSKIDRATTKSSAKDVITDEADLESYTDLEIERQSLEGKKGFIEKKKLKEVNQKLEELYGKYSETAKEDIQDSLQKEIKEIQGDRAKNIFESGVKKKGFKDFSEYKNHMEAQYQVAREMGEKIGSKTFIAEDSNTKPEGLDDDAWNRFRESGATGVYDPKTNSIIINKDASNKSFSINIGVHEPLHPIFYRKIGGVSQQAKMVDDVKKLLTSKQRGIINSELKNRRYNRKEYALEYLTVLSDSIANDKINFTGEQKNFYDKIVEIFQKIINRNSEIQFDIGFENGGQVLEFIKTFTADAKAGKISEDVFTAVEKAPDVVSETQQENTVLKSLDDDLMDLQDQLAFGDISQEQYDAAYDRLLEGTQEAKVEPKVDTRDFKKTLDDIGNNPAGYNPFDLNLEPTLRQMIIAKSKRFRTQSGDVVNLENLPGFKMEDFASEVYFNMMKGKTLPDGGFADGYIKVFDPEVNDSLYGYINAQLGNRMRSVLGEGKMTQEKFTVRAEDQIGLQDEGQMFDEMIDEEISQQEQEEINLIHPAKIFNNDKFFSDAETTVKETFFDVHPKDLIFKNTKNLVVKPMAEFMGIRESVIEKASQNLNTSELEKTAPILFEAADDIIQIIPKGAIISDGAPLAVSEKLIGTGTGLPRKILNAFFEKKQRLLSGQEGIGRKGAGLEPFVKKEISKSDFLGAIGINEDGTHNTDIKPKSPESQTRRALIDLLGKLATNTFGRGLLLDRGAPLNIVNDYAAGIDEMMMSRPDLSDLDLNDFFLDLKSSISHTKQFVPAIQEVLKNPIVSSMLSAYGITEEEVMSSFRSYQRGGLKVDGIKNTYHYDKMKKTIEQGTNLAGYLPNVLKKKSYSGVYKNYFPVIDSNLAEKIAIGKIRIVDKNGKEIQADDKRISELVEKYNNFSERLKTKQRKVALGDKGALNRPTVKEANLQAQELAREQGLRGIPYLSNAKMKLKQIVGIVDKSKFVLDVISQNPIRTAFRNLYIVSLADYVHQDNLSKKARVDRIGFILHNLAIDSPANEAFKHTAELVPGMNILLDEKGNVQLEHLKATSKYNAEVFAAIMLNTLPSKGYPSSFMPSQISTILDGAKDKDVTVVVKGKEITIKGKQARTAPQEVKIEAVKEAVEETELSDFLYSKVNEEEMEFMMGNIIKNISGIPVSERVSQSTAKIMAANRNKKWRLLSPSADDFVGLLYSTLGKGKVGDAQLKFYKKYLIDPFNRANHAMDAARQKISRNFKDLNKEYEVVKKSLGKKTGYKDYTNDQAIRVYLYKKAGASNSVLSINEADEKALLDIVDSNKEFKEYAEYLMEITELDNSWIEPSPNWVVGSVFDDVNSIIDRLKRAEYLSEWKQNVDAIFSENNRNKLEGYFGEDYRKALDDMLYRMEKGKAIPEKMNKEMNRFQQWLTGSVAVTMFLNRRSAVLQTISNINYMNWSDNNPIAAAKAFANTGQFAKDFALIFNSDYLKQRRGGLKTEVEAAVLANELRKGGVEGMRGAINKLLKAGFTLTQLGDSFAISFGGASFYRNRKNSYLKQGLTEQEARDQAFLDFREISEESQQSARPDRLSMQQTNSIGRVFLAFQNTPMQYYRLIAKAIMDIKNGRGDLKTNISKIAYYGIAQNLMFTALQQALFAFLFDAPDDEEEEETKDEKVLRTINNSIDTIIRGTGYYGAVVSTVKNVILEFIKQEKKGFKADHAYTMVQALNLSAPIGIKARTLYQGAYQNYKYNKEIIDDLGYDIDNPGYDIVASLASFGVNVPLDKVIQMTRGIKEASDKDNEAWQRIALALGWSTWNLGMPNEKIEKAKEINTKRKKAEAARKRKIETSRKARKRERKGL